MHPVPKFLYRRVALWALLALLSFAAGLASPDIAAGGAALLLLGVCRQCVVAGNLVDRRARRPAVAQLFALDRLVDF